MVLFLPICNVFWPRWNCPAGSVSCCVFSFCSGTAEKASGSGRRWWWVVPLEEPSRRVLVLVGWGILMRWGFFLMFEQLQSHILICKTNLQKIAAATGVKEVMLLHEKREKVGKIVLRSKNVVLQ